MAVRPVASWHCCQTPSDSGHGTTDRLHSALASHVFLGLCLFDCHARLGYVHRTRNTLKVRDMMPKNKPIEVSLNGGRAGIEAALDGDSSMVLCVGNGRSMFF